MLKLCVMIACMGSVVNDLDGEWGGSWILMDVDVFCIKGLKILVVDKIKK